MAHNVWNKGKGFAQAQVIYSFGRRDQLDVDTLKRLVKSLSRFLDPQDALALQNQSDSSLSAADRPVARIFSKPSGTD